MNTSNAASGLMIIDQAADSSEQACQHQQRHWILNMLDTSGALASLVCALHCMATPVVLVLMPALGALFSHEAVHSAMFAVALPIALVTLGFSTWRTKRWLLLLIGLFGCSLLALGLELEHHYGFGWSSPATWTNILGGVILASTHAYNLRLRANHKFC